MYARVYECIMHVCTHACTYACMRVCVYACMNVITYAPMHVCTHARMHLCMYACMYACMHVCMHVYACICMYVCMYAFMYACMHVCMYACIRSPQLERSDSQIVVWETMYNRSWIARARSSIFFGAVFAWVRCIRNFMQNLQHFWVIVQWQSSQFCTKLPPNCTERGTTPGSHNFQIAV